MPDRPAPGTVAALSAGLALGLLLGALAGLLRAPRAGGAEQDGAGR